MKRRFALGVLALVLVLTAIGGCSLLGNKITILVDNSSDLPMRVWYRVSGDTEWLDTEVGLFAGYTDYFDLPMGTYDFRVTTLATSDPDDSTGFVDEELDVLMDYQYNWDDESSSYDYEINIYNSSISVF